MEISWRVEKELICERCEATEESEEGYNEDEIPSLCSWCEHITYESLEK